MDFIEKLWFGDYYSLRTTFFGFYVGGFIASLLLAACVVFPITHSLHQRTIGIIIFHLIIWPYWLLASIGVWRSAAYAITSTFWDRVWVHSARMLVLMFAARVAYALFQMVVR